MPWRTRNNITRTLAVSGVATIIGVGALSGVASANEYQITARCGAPFAVSVPKAEDGTRLVVTLNGERVHSSTAFAFGDPLYWQLDNPDPTRSHTLTVLIDSVWNEDYRETRVVPACVVATTTTTTPPTTTVPATTTTTVPPLVSVPPPPVPSSTTVPPVTSTTVVQPPRTPIVPRTPPTTTATTVPPSVPPVFTLPETGPSDDTDNMVNIGGIALIIGLLLIMVAKFRPYK
jgi:hypothetical protein